MSASTDLNLNVPLTTSIFNKHPTNYQPNLFTESRQEFTELEKKIVVLVVNQIGHMSLKGDLKEGANVKFQIPFTELTRARYDQISAAAETLQLKRLMYRNDKTQKFDFITPFPRVRSEIVNGKKVIELTMFADVVPHFAELGQRYTKYDIDIMLSLSSVYAQRMFEVVSMFHNRGQKQFRYGIDQLRMLLNCPESYSYNDFRKNALLVAQRELQDKANILLEWAPAKKIGKRIIELDFLIKTALQIAKEEVKEDQRMINQLTVNEAVTLAWQRMAFYKLKSWQKDLIISEHNLLDTFLRVDSELVNGLRPGIKNPTAYLVKSLAIDQSKAPRRTSTKLTPKQKERSIIPVRTGSAQSIAAIMNDLFYSKE